MPKAQYEAVNMLVPTDDKTAHADGRNLDIHYEHVNAERTINKTFK